MIPENTGPAAVIVLAAGAGTRMKSRTPKILHEIGGRSMVGHALLRCPQHQPAAGWPWWSATSVTWWPATSPSWTRKPLIVDQDEVPGTGRAVEVAAAGAGRTAEAWPAPWW